MAIGALTTPEAFGLVAAVVSIVLAGFAIWQASTFYRWSEAASKESTTAARDIRASVERIEKLFDTFYTDTFGLMKDTYSDFRKHTWETGSGEEGKTETKKFEELRLELRQEVEALTVQGTSTEQQISDLRDEMESLVDRAIDQSQVLETRLVEKQVRPLVLRRLREAKAEGESVMSVASFWRSIPVGGGRLFASLNVLLKLRDTGFVDFTMKPEWRDHDELPADEALIRFNFKD
jgi:hypothetical protein